MFIINIVYYILFITIALYGIYFAITGLFAFKKEVEDKELVKKENYFSILIAARNEEKVIANLIKSLQDLNYNKDKYEINIIVNNCTDDTSKIAKKLKANVYQCKNKITCKGDAIKEALSVFNDKKIDAYVIFDADNIVHKDFLLEMNKSINCGFKVAQGFRDTKNVSDNWLTGSYALFYYIQNFFFNKSRKLMNLSASINGTGFMFKKSVIDDIGFNTHTITEDVEFTGICAINKIKVDFVEKAITYDEQPTSFRVSWNQRVRWSKGNLQCFKLYFKDLVKHLFKDKNLSCLDMILNYFTPIIQIISFLTFGILFTYKIFNMPTYDILSTFLASDYLPMIIMYVMGLFVSLYVLLYYNKRIDKMLSAFFLFTLFILSWIPINIVCVLKKDIKWDHIEHNKNIKIGEIE